MPNSEPPPSRYIVRVALGPERPFISSSSRRRVEPRGIQTGPGLPRYEPAKPLVKPTNKDRDAARADAQRKITEIIGEDRFIVDGQRTVEVEGISSDTWDSLEEMGFTEDAGAKLKYFPDTEIVVITCPSVVHESFHDLFKSFSETVRQIPSFSIATNTDFLSSNRTPDMAVVRQVGKFPVVIECAFGQDTAALRQKIKTLHSFDGVLVVIALIIDGGKPNSCPSSLAPPKVARPITEVLPDSAVKNVFRKDVEFEGHVWAKKITGLSVLVHQRGAEEQLFQLPLDFRSEPARKLRDQIDKCIYGILKQILPGETYKQFAGLCWGGFHSAFPRAIHTMAYRCYVRWVGESAPLPQEAQEKNLKRTAELDIDEEFTANKRTKRGEAFDDLEGFPDW